MVRGIMVVESNPTEGREDEYNDWYGRTHVPQILEIPGIRAAQRYRVSSSRMRPDAQPGYLAIYELEADDLAGPIDELLARSADGRIEMSDALRLSPPPVVTVYELLE
jgi:hypothetical protein